MTRTEIETALDTGKLWALMRNGAYWKLRRNGKTHTLVRAPGCYSIPVKAGLKSCGRITETSVVTDGPGGDFVISNDKPE